jgi:hypothetical protein
VNFFCDNNLSPKIAHALNCLVSPQHKVVHLRDRFAADTTDIEWITALANEDGWVIISADTSIAKNPHEREAWRASGHPVFFYRHNMLNLGLWQQASRLCNVFPDILKLSQKASPGDYFYIPAKGKIAAGA